MSLTTRTVVKKNALFGLIQISVFGKWGVHHKADHINPRRRGNKYSPCDCPVASLVTWWHSANPYGSGQVTKLWLSCCLVLLSIDSKNQITRQPQFRDLTHMVFSTALYLLTFLLGKIGSCLVPNETGHPPVDNNYTQAKLSKPSKYWTVAILVGHWLHWMLCLKRNRQINALQRLTNLPDYLSRKAI